MLSKKLKTWKKNKAIQDTKFPVKFLKYNANFFSGQIYFQFDYAIFTSKFPASIEFGNITLVF